MGREMEVGCISADGRRLSVIVAVFVFRAMNLMRRLEGSLLGPVTVGR